MIKILTDIFVVSLLGSALAAILVIADKLISNYGTCEIDINDGEIKKEVKGGAPLLETLTAEKIFIPSACGGRGSCGYCKVKVTDGAGPILPTEEPYLTPKEKADNIRLSCQIKIRNNIKIQLPKELLSIKEFDCVCTDIKELTYDMRQFQFTLNNGDEMRYIPGQYVQLLAPVYDKSDEEVYRAYSIASDPKNNKIIELIIRLVPGGICTTYCFNYLKVGDKVKLNGPYGEFRLSDTESPIIYIAGGSGMAPIKCLLNEMKNTGSKRQAVYFFGVNTEKDLCMVDEMKQFEADLCNFKFIPVMARPENPSLWKGETGLVTEAVARNVTNGATAEAYLCGSPGMIDASIKTLNSLGITNDRIFYDKFA